MGSTPNTYRTNLLKKFNANIIQQLAKSEIEFGRANSVTPIAGNAAKAEKGLLISIVTDARDEVIVRPMDFIHCQSSGGGNAVTEEVEEGLRRSGVVRGVRLGAVRRLSDAALTGGSGGNAVVIIAVRSRHYLLIKPNLL